MSVMPFPASQESGAVAPEQTDAVDARQRMVGRALASQQELEQLLKQGKAHLQDLRGRLHLTVTERDRLQAEIVDRTSAHRHAIEEIERQLDDVRAQLQAVTAERNRVAAQLAEQAAAHEEFARERADERSTFTRLLDEASFTKGEMTEKLEEQRQQIDNLREAAMRAQSLAREIIGAHEATDAIPDRTKA